MLTEPIIPADLRTAYPDEVRGMDDDQLRALLQVHEYALRAQYRVTRVDADSDAAIAAAIIASWPSLLQQVRSVASESVGIGSASVVYGQTGALQFPRVVSSMLHPVSDGGGSSIRLVRC